MEASTDPEVSPDKSQADPVINAPIKSSSNAEETDTKVAEGVHDEFIVASSKIEEDKEEITLSQKFTSEKQRINAILQDLAQEVGNEFEQVGIDLDKIKNKQKKFEHIGGILQKYEKKYGATLDKDDARKIIAYILSLFKEDTSSMKTVKNTFEDIKKLINFHY